MRNLFPGYFKPTREELSRLWNEGLIVPDTNVWLDPYRMSQETTDALLGILEAFRERIRVPYQFAQEFARNRFELLVQHRFVYRDRVELVRNLIAELQSKRSHPFLPSEQIDGLEKIRIAFELEERKHQDLITQDPMLERILGLMEPNVGPPPDDLPKWHDEAKSRYAKQIPPGYKDQKKDEPDCWGDFLGWRQMIAIAINEKKPVVFVTSDVKEDWWWRIKGETIGPRHELKAEFYKESGVPFYIYRTDQFVKMASEHLERDLPPRTIEELAETREQLPGSREKAIPTLEVPVGVGLVDGPPKNDRPLADKLNDADKAGGVKAQKENLPKPALEDD